MTVFVRMNEVERDSELRILESRVEEPMFKVFAEIVKFAVLFLGDFLNDLSKHVHKLVLPRERVFRQKRRRGQDNPRDARNAFA